MEIDHIEGKGFFINDEKGETIVSPSLRGQGIADKLLNAGVEYAEKKGYKIVPVCSYIVKKFRSSRYDYIRG